MVDDRRIGRIYQSCQDPTRWDWFRQVEPVANGRADSLAEAESAILVLSELPE